MPAPDALAAAPPLEAALSEEFLGVRRILGAARFRSIVEDFLSHLPAFSPGRSRPASRFPAFLEAHELSLGMPFLPELARLERAVSEAVAAEDVAPLSWEAVRNLDAEDAAGLPLVVRPGTSLVRSCGPIVDLWRLRLLPEEVDTGLDVRGRPQAALIVRPWTAVYVHVLSDAEADLFSAARDRSTTPSILLPPGDADGAAAFRRLVLLGVFAEEPTCTVARGDSAVCLPILSAAGRS